MSFQKELLSWFKKNQRPLPWRRRYRPYEVWVSEIMLQQTQMDTVLPYFRRWMAVFPDIQSLAAAKEEKVLKLWQGLGYYSRARNLHRTAKVLVKKNGGEFPSDYASILSLKGVGRYTAGAIASIAFNQEKPIVDGNILRVLSRVYAIEKPIDVPKNLERFWELQESLIPAGQARDFNQALMELGALVCAPTDPNCPTCPLKSFCAAAKTGKAEEYPRRQKKKTITKVTASAVILSHKERYLIRRRPTGKVMGGLWEFPEWKLSKGRTLSAKQVLDKTQKLLHHEFGVEAAPRPLSRIKRNYTRYSEDLEVFSLNTGTRPNPRTLWPHVWVSKTAFTKYPFSSAHSKIAALITN